MIARLVLIAILAALASACATSRATTRPVPVPVPESPARPTLEERGMASWYGHPHHGRKTANGETFDMHAMTAAHRTLPFGTWLHVENLNNGQSARVRVNDRGPYVGKRILDVSRAAAMVLGMMGPGVVPVRLRVVEAPTAAPATFSVQVGAFSEEERAVALRQSLAQAGVTADVVRAESAGQVVHRVRTGRYTTRAEADAAAAKFSRDGYSALVVAD